MDDRGLTPVVSEALVIGLVLLYIGLLTALLYGSVIPTYQTASGAEIGDRVLTTATERVEQEIHPSYRLDARSRVDLPSTINDRAYSIRATNRTLVLEHPHPEIGGRTRPALPGSVSAINGSWRSHTPLIIRIMGNETGYRITIEDGNDATEQG